ncbi:MAG: NAD(P)/FAD-dependent oxidoreductase [Lachnospiraceae bacterium]|nr:NAD(P)/FAD-dependent oxidoreductase [Lachnospiraceae bacterium]
MGGTCIVIGGGAAGMMAAYSAGLGGGYDEVILVEKNEKLGKKVYITGKGRCNVTNNCEPESFFDNVVSNPKFLYSAYYGFDNNALMGVIEDNGCKLKTERGDRVFPVSDHSSDIIKAMEKAVRKAGVKIMLNCEVKELLLADSKDGASPKHITGVRLKNGDKLNADKVIVATGGLSYPSTGSTGDGHKWLKSLGHTITKCKPALVPLTVKEVNECKAMQGLALKNVAIKLCRQSDNDSAVTDSKNKSHHKKNLIYEGFGEMLFTHFGVSGPLILSASSRYVKDCYDTNAVLHIDLKPALNTEQLDKRILRDFDEAKNKDFRNVLTGLLPSSMIDVVVARSGIDANKKVNSITSKERENLVNLIKDYVLHITGTRDYNEAIITQGGIKVSEVNPGTMESKLIKGLYIAGELLDVDAYTGGFNLQIAWSTGHLAGTI